MRFTLPGVSLGKIGNNKFSAGTFSGLWVLVFLDSMGFLGTIDCEAVGVGGLTFGVEGTDSGVSAVVLGVVAVARVASSVCGVTSTTSEGAGFVCGVLVPLLVSGVFLELDFVWCSMTGGVTSTTSEGVGFVRGGLVPILKTGEFVTFSVSEVFLELGFV